MRGSELFAARCAAREPRINATGRGTICLAGTLISSGTFERWTMIENRVGTQPHLLIIPDDLVRFTARLNLNGRLESVPIRSAQNRQDAQLNPSIVRCR